MAHDDVLLTFRFTGGDATENQLNFYDASRFMYGAARFLYTLEQFRQTGRVLRRISEKVNVDYRISTPSGGSWLLHVLAVSQPVISNLVYKVPMHVLVAWITHKILDPSRSKQDVVDLAKERTAQEVERTKQSQEETRRLEITQSNNREFLKIIDKLIDQRRFSEPSDAQIAKDVRREIRATIARQNIFAGYKKELDKIDDDKRERLENQIFGQISEIGRPLIRSASGLHIAGKNIKAPFIFMNRRTVESLAGHTEDPIPSTLVGNIIRYDKETGWGKFKSKEFARPISFLVPSHRKNELTYEVIEAMKEDKVEVTLYNVRDNRGTVKYFVFERILDIGGGAFAQ